MAAERGEGKGRSGFWIIVWGILLIVAGMAAIVQPAPAALAFALLLAWLLVFAGAVQLVDAWQQRGQEGFAWKLVSALSTLILGIVMLTFPIAGIASVSLLIGAFLLVSGVSHLLLALRLRPRPGWGWVLFDGVLAIIVAAMIASGWPQSSYQFVGILVGFMLISGGLWRIVVGRAMRGGGVRSPT